MTPTNRQRFRLYKDTAGMWRWRVTHENGNVIEDSHQGYTVKKNARRNAGLILFNDRNAFDFLRGSRGVYDDWLQRATDD